MHERRLKGADDARLQLGNARGRAAEEAIAPDAPLPRREFAATQRIVVVRRLRPAVVFGTHTTRLCYC